MLVVNRDALGLVDVLNLSHQTVLQVGDRLLGGLHQRLAAAQIFEVALEQLVGVDRAIGQQFTSGDLLAIAHHDVAAEQDRIFTDGVIGFDHVDGEGLVVFTLLDLNGAGLLAENRGFTGATGLQQFFDSGQTLNDVTSLLAFEHQQGQAITPLHQISITHVQDGVGRHHVGTSQTQGDAVAADGLDLTTAAGGFAVGKGVAIDNPLTDAHHRLAGGAQGGGVFGAFHDHPTHRVGFRGFGQLRQTGLLAEDLRGSDDIASLH